MRILSTGFKCNVARYLRCLTQVGAASLACAQNFLSNPNLNHRLTPRLMALLLGFFIMTETTLAQSTSGALSAAAVEEVLNQSLTQKKGMSIYIGGQVVNAIFVKRIDANTIEVKNQTFGRIIIRMDRIDAIAIS